MKKPLSYFRHMTRQNIAKLDGLKSIMRVDQPRTCSWWIVIPTTGEEDSVCVKIDSCRIHPRGREIWMQSTQDKILTEYGDRITA
jgi:hypothetical protein